MLCAAAALATMSAASSASRSLWSTSSAARFSRGSGASAAPSLRADTAAWIVVVRFEAERTSVCMLVGCEGG